MNTQLEQLESIISDQKAEIYKLKNIIENLPGSIYWKNEDGVYQGRNNTSAESMRKFGFPWQWSEIIGKTDHDLFDKTMADRFRKNDLEVIESGREFIKEEVATLPSGEQVVQLSTKRPLWNERGHVIGLVGNTVDITYLKKIEAELRSAKEKAEASDKAKTEFLENMRHDIRTPLTGMMGFANMIKQEATDPKIKEYSDNLIASSSTLFNLLNEVLEFIKVSSGEIPILKKKFDLKKKLNDIILLNQAKASQKNLNLLFEGDPDIPTYLIGDAIRVQRIILELVTNALNFTNTGYVKLSTQLAKNSEKNVIVKIMVEDTGIGIPKEQQQEIYVQFKRLTPSYEGIYKGFGLGLSIAKQLIEDIQGELYVESEVNRGTKFTFIISLKKTLLDEELGTEELAPLLNSQLIQAFETNSFQRTMSETAPIKNRVLLVEDNTIAAQVVSHMISTLGCNRVDVADTGKMAIQLAKNNVYDLIFMDIGLPDIDGYETTRQIRLNELNKKHVPIVALTAHLDEDNKQFFIDSGINAMLSKPLLKDKAKDILNSFIPYWKNESKPEIEVKK
jgi:signal transduction histidine kinase/AmiR/NasT family two-component response regulator